MSEAARIDLVDRAPLTEKQQNVYESIMQYQRVNGYAPTIREICKMVAILKKRGVVDLRHLFSFAKNLLEKFFVSGIIKLSKAKCFR